MTTTRVMATCGDRETSAWEAIQDLGRDVNGSSASENKSQGPLSFLTELSHNAQTIRVLLQCFISGAAYHCVARGLESCSETPKEKRARSRTIKDHSCIILRGLWTTSAPYRRGQAGAGPRCIGDFSLNKGRSRTGLAFTNCRSFDRKHRAISTIHSSGRQVDSWQANAHR